MTRALRENGPVVRIKRNGQTEFLVSDECTQQVLTRADTFSFEDALAKIMGMTLLHRWIGQGFLRDVHRAIQAYWDCCKHQVASHAAPIFERAAAEVAAAGEGGQPVDIAPYINRAVTELTLKVLLGKKYAMPEYCHRTHQVVEDLVELTGLNRQQSRLGRGFPILWTIKTWIEVAVFRLPQHLGVHFACCVWADIGSTDASEKNLISHLVSKYADADGVVPTGPKIRIMVMVWSIIFGAVHQTAAISVWVSFFLARRRDMQDAICREHDATRALASVVGDSKEASEHDLSRAVYADSFIREVLRMKPDAVNAARVARKDTELAGYFIPKGSLIFPVTFLSDRNPRYLSNPDVFDPERWLWTGKTAAMPGAGHLAFGLGRWACPGRFLSVIEIKLWILALAKVATFELEGDSYEIMDAFNISTFAPRGRLLVSKRTA
ncbi:Cytochrome P450 [Akanthomyces lecanii RCEF 1005]|uniref:Cytochrome P450 n=1 Tax=Akanthomyces lecanii RCEF 1005 TaxID=1081108 RepID=A0A162K5F3_CORDF|nr:Cytochrome P450 [Akanthomyces lecanii RCEF 1005]